MNTSLSNKIMVGVPSRPTVDSDQIFPSTVHTITEPEVLIEFSIDSILSILGAHAGSFFIWDEFQKELVLRAVRGPYRNRQSRPHVKLREGILGVVGEQGTSILVKDIESDNRFKSLPRRGNYRSGSFISIPLIAHNKLVGVINVTERENLIAFNEEDLRLAERFCDHVAIALENLRLIQRLQGENDQLHQRTALLKQALKEQETLVSVGKLAANLTHELNNPLDAIRRYVNLALDQALEDSLTREYLVKAKKGIRRAIRVIRGLLQYSRDIHRNDVRTVELHSLISESLEAVMQHPTFEKISVQKDFVPETVYVADRGLPMVLQNLFQNACHAMNGEGTIRISTERTNEKVTLKVQDTGCGLSDSEASRIFEPFYTTKETGQGNGIGLTLCREIVERSGGNITCKATPKKGASFLITLPCTGR